MSGEEINICPECGKNIQEKRGSLTQWVGLGDACKCDQKDVGNPTTTTLQKKKSGKKCKRCRKPISSKQSMTQWLIKTEICKCPPESDSLISTDYTQLAMSKRNLHRKPRQAENKSLVAFMCIGVLLFILVSGYAILDILGISHAWRLLGGRLTGNERKLIVGSRILTVYDMPANEEGWNKPEIQDARQVRIKDSTISDDDLKHLAANSNLFRVILKNCDGFTADGVSAFQKNPGLNLLSFDSSKIDAAILKALGNVKVDRLDLSNTDIAHADWSVLLNNPGLETLDITGVPISDANRSAFETQGYKQTANYFIRPRK